MLNRAKYLSEFAIAAYGELNRPQEQRISGGLVVRDANGQSLAYVSSRETKDANKCERDPASGPFLCNLDLLIMLGGLLLGPPG